MFKSLSPLLILALCNFSTGLNKPVVYTGHDRQIRKPTTGKQRFECPRIRTEIPRKLFNSMQY